MRAPGRLRSGRRGARFRVSNLDTYKQFAQPSIHAGSSPIQGL
jgi:hypothetical protein